MAYIKCPECQQANPSDAETCSNCGAVLHEAIQPGELPVKKSTSELEPILPQWLQDAREKARKSTGSSDLEPPLESTKPAGAGTADLLAGLEAQSAEEDEEVPDWLAGITGSKGKKKKPPAFSGARRVELEGFQDFASEDQQPPQSRAEEKNEGELNLEDWFKKATLNASEQTGTPSREEARPEEVFQQQRDEIAPSTEQANDILDWLSNLKAEEAKEPVKPDALQNESLPSWLQAQSPESAVPTEPSEMPEWLRNLEGGDEEHTELQAEKEATAPVDWLEQFRSELPPAESQQPAEPTNEIDFPDWLKGLTTESGTPEPIEAGGTVSEEASPLDWVKEIEGQEAAKPSGAEASEPISPNWLEDLRATPETPPHESDDIEIPEWIGPSADTLSTSPEMEEPEALEKAGLPDWFMQAEEQAPLHTSEPEASQILSEAELPEWLTPPSGEGQATPGAEESAVPDWLSLGNKEPEATSEFKIETSSVLDGTLPEWLQNTSQESPTPAQDETEMPSWLGNAGSAATGAKATDDAAQPVEGPEALPEWPTVQTSLEIPSAEEKPAIADQISAQEPVPSESLGTLFTDVPDWLSEAKAPSIPETEGLPPAVDETESLEPGALPSWVQAMRPVEAALPRAGTIGDDIMETEGALAGLHGVLPSTPYHGPSSRPKAQSIKLQASEDQQSHANLLEEILAAETRPEPMTVMPKVAAQRALRIAIGSILFVVLLAAIFSGSQVFPLPLGWPTGAVEAIRAVEAIPPGSPVLVVFDYEPSLAGEMEAVAAPLLDHLIIRNHPRLTFISTSPTGSSMAERLMNGTLRELQYKDYANLGYLPGGLGGVRSFAQDPLAAMPLTADSATPAWSTAQTQGIQRLADYSAIIAIVDRADAGRTWIEQTEGFYGGTAFVVVSSAQAGPMLEPYYESGQVNGLVSGLFDAAVLEQNNAGRPGLARKYWDAYTLALIAAILLISGGALWNLFASVRERLSGKAG